MRIARQPSPGNRHLSKNLAQVTSQFVPKPQKSSRLRSTSEIQKLRLIYYEADEQTINNFTKMTFISEDLVQQNIKFPIIQYGDWISSMQLHHG